MGCHHIHHLLPQYSVDSLDARTADRVRAHLADCPACAAELAALTRTGDLLNALPTPAPPPDLWARVAAETIEQPHVRRAPAVWWRPVTVAAAAVVVLLGGLSLRTGPSAPVMQANAVTNNYAYQYRLARVQDPLVDRAAIGLALVEGEK